MATRLRKKVTEADTTEESVKVEKAVEEATVPAPAKEPLKPIEPIAPVVTAETPIRWRKIGGGSFILNNRFIKPGQVFTAKASEIPFAFRDLVIPLDKLPDPDVNLLIKKQVNYVITPVADTDTYNIVDKQGKILNEAPMSKEEAESFLTVL